MKKFIDVKTGKEIKDGDEITVKFTKNGEFYHKETVLKFKFSETLALSLIKFGVIKEVTEDDKEVNMDKIWKAVLANIQRKSSGLDAEKWVFPYIRNINECSLVNILLKEIAMQMDKKYKNHISETESIYVISSVNGKIYKCPTSEVKCFAGFAAFRTKEEAETAKVILKKYYFDKQREQEN